MRKWLDFRQLRRYQFKCLGMTEKWHYICRPGKIWMHNQCHIKAGRCFRSICIWKERFWFAARILIKLLCTSDKASITCQRRGFFSLSAARRSGKATRRMRLQINNFTHTLANFFFNSIRICLTAILVWITAHKCDQITRIRWFSPICS